MRVIASAAFAFSAFISYMPVLFACSVCFGDPNSLQSKALGGAVLFLLAVIGGVLTVIALLGYTWAQRAKKLSEQSAASA